MQCPGCSRTNSSGFTASRASLLLESAWLPLHLIPPTGLWVKGARVPAAAAAAGHYPGTAITAAAVLKGTPMQVKGLGLLIEHRDLPLLYLLPSLQPTLDSGQHQVTHLHHSHPLVIDGL